MCQQSIHKSLTTLEKVLDFTKTLLYQISEPGGISIRRALEGRHVEENDVISLDDVRYTITILSNLAEGETMISDLSTQILVQCSTDCQL